MFKRWILNTICQINTYPQDNGIACPDTHPLNSTTIECWNNLGRIRVGAGGSRTFLESEIIFHLKEVSSIAKGTGFWVILLKLSLPNIILG